MLQPKMMKKTLMAVLVFKNETKDKTSNSAIQKVNKETRTRKREIPNKRKKKHTHDTRKA